MSYETTTVPVEKSQGQIRKLLADAGASRMGFAEERGGDGIRRALVQFAIGVHAVRLMVPLKVVDERAVRQKAGRAHTKSTDQVRDELYAQEERRIWRVLAWNLKARMVAVDEKVETFEEAFLAHLLNPLTGRTIYESLAEAGTVSLDRPLRQIEAAA